MRPRARCGTDTRACRAWPRSTDFHLRRSVTPISEERERPRIAPRGRFLLRVREWRSKASARLQLHPMASGPGWPARWDFRCEALPLERQERCARDAGHGRRAVAALRNGLALAKAPMRNIDGHVPAAWACVPSGARGTAVAHAEACEAVFRERTIAQLGRAAAQAVGHRFESGSSSTG